MSAKKKAIRSKKSKKKAYPKRTVKRAKTIRREKSRALTPPPFKGFYPNTVVASMISALLLNATEDRKPFNDVEAQLQGAVDMAKSSHLDGARDYETNVTVLRDFCQKKPANKELFVKANLAIAELLQALINKPEQDWSGCFHVNHATIKGIFSLKD